MKIKKVEYLESVPVIQLTVSNRTYVSGHALHHNCNHCWHLWTMPDKATPKVYKMSELSGSPGHWKNPSASISPTHVHCRDILTVLMPGFGFEGSKIVYKGKDYDEYKKQRGND